MEWQLIETCPEYPFNKELWFRNGPSYLVWTGYGVTIASYGYTQNGKGRWQDWRGNLPTPSHWMPLPETPK